MGVTSGTKGCLTWCHTLFFQSGMKEMVLRKQSFKAETRVSFLLTRTFKAEGIDAYV